MKRAVCFYSCVLFVEHRVFELYSHSALGQHLVSDASQFPSCNCIGQPWTKTRVIFASSIECFSQDCKTVVCNQGDSHATLLADVSTPFFLPWSFQAFSTIFYPWKVWGPILTPFHNKTITCDPDLRAGHLHIRMRSCAAGKIRFRKEPGLIKVFVLACHLVSY